MNTRVIRFGHEIYPHLVCRFGSLLNTGVAEPCRFRCAVTLTSEVNSMVAVSGLKFGTRTESDSFFA